MLDPPVQGSPMLPSGIIPPTQGGMFDGAEEETMELFGESGKAGTAGLMVVDMMNDVIVARLQMRRVSQDLVYHRYKLVACLELDVEHQ